MKRLARACVTLLLPVQLAGCYGYAAMREPPVPGEPLRARLTPGGAAWLVENFGRNRQNVDGTFVREDDASVVFTTWRADLPNSAQFRASIDTLYIPREHLAALEQRQLSIGRTAIAAAIGAGIVVLAVSELAGAGGSSGGNGGGPPLLVLPLRLPFAR